MFFIKLRQGAKKKSTARQDRRRRKDCRAGRSFRPRLEPLEDRCMLSNAGIIWSSEFGSPDVADDLLSSVALNAMDVYVGGAASGALPGQTFEGAADAFVRKYSRACKPGKARVPAIGRARPGRRLSRVSMAAPHRRP